MKHAIVTHLAVGQRLGAVAKRVGQGIQTIVGNFEVQLLLHQRELDHIPLANDRARADVATNAQPFGISLIAHLTQFGDSFVIGLVFLDPGGGQPD